MMVKLARLKVSLYIWEKAFKVGRKYKENNDCRRIVLYMASTFHMSVLTAQIPTTENL